MVLEKKPMLLKNLGKFGTNGSKEGMQFILRKEGEELAAYVFPEPFAFDYTDAVYKTRQAFMWSEDGYDEAIRWINSQYEERLEEWAEAKKSGILNAKTHLTQNYNYIKKGNALFEVTFPFCVKPEI